MGATNHGGHGGKIQGSQHMNDGQRNFQNSNERNPDHNRSDTQKHQYSDYDQSLTDDGNYTAGKPNSLGDDMDFRDKDENLEDSENQ
jgi:hypothetical protein